MKTTRYIRVVVCLSLMIVLLAHPITASACSCAGPSSPTQEFQESNAVFTGKVLRIVDEYIPIFSTLDRVLTAIGQQSYFWSQAGRYVGYRIYFGVNSSWKGIAKTTVMIDTGYGAGDCGYPFAVNNDYLVYASYPYGIPDNYWVTSICSRNAEISAAREDLRYLNSLPTLSLNPSFQIFGLPLSVVALWVIFFLIAIIIFLYAHRRHVLGWED